MAINSTAHRAKITVAASYAVLSDHNIERNDF